MSLDFKVFLAASVLNNGDIVSYRSLGRALKVHSNAAKKMLYEFYDTQRIKEPGSINATYLLDGVPKASRQSYVNGHGQEGEDTHMQSSPYMSSSAPHQDDQDDAAPSRTVVLANEDDLEAAKAQLKQIYSIHIYSLSPSKVQNLQILSDCNRAISVKYANEDPLEFQEKLGVIHNAGVKRRTSRRPCIGIPQILSGNIDEKAQSKTKGFNQGQKNAVKPFDGSPSGDKLNKPAQMALVAQEIKVDESRHAEKQSASKRSARKSSDAFKSFSRPNIHLRQENADVSFGVSHASDTTFLESKSVEEDGAMKDASEDEQEDNFMASTIVKPRILKSQSERAEQLRRMMEDEDEPMEDNGPDVLQISQGSGSLDSSNSQKDTTPTPPVVMTDGRRRGRRKVMKKKTMRDEEGYLVTVEEPAWESFSEDDIPQKSKTLTSTTTSSLAKGKKSGGKPGQGNIMTFFGKK